MSTTVSRRPSPTVLFALVPGVAASSFRLARRPDGTRVALAFSDVAHLHAALGPEAPSVRMCLAAAHALLGPIGVQEVCVDPPLVTEPRRTRGRAA